MNNKPTIVGLTSVIALISVNVGHVNSTMMSLEQDGEAFYQDLLKQAFESGMPQDPWYAKLIRNFGKDAHEVTQDLNQWTGANGPMDAGNTKWISKPTLPVTCFADGLSSFERALNINAHNDQRFKLPGKSLNYAARGIGLGDTHCSLPGCMNRNVRFGLALTKTNVFPALWDFFNSEKFYTDESIVAGFKNSMVVDMIKQEISLGSMKKFWDEVIVPLSELVPDLFKTMCPGTYVQVGPSVGSCIHSGSTSFNPQAYFRDTFVKSGLKDLSPFAVGPYDTANTIVTLNKTDVDRRYLVNELHAMATSTPEERQQYESDHGSFNSRAKWAYRKWGRSVAVMNDQFSGAKQDFSMCITKITIGTVTYTMTQGVCDSGSLKHSKTISIRDTSVTYDSQGRPGLPEVWAGVNTIEAFEPQGFYYGKTVREEVVEMLQWLSNLQKRPTIYEHLEREYAEWVKIFVKQASADNCNRENLTLIESTAGLNMICGERKKDKGNNLRNLKWRWADHFVPFIGIVRKMQFVPKMQFEDRWNMPVDRAALVEELMKKALDPKAAAKQYTRRRVEFADVDYPKRRRTFADYTKALDWLALEANIQSREDL